eukprot:3772501-Ditylum_brightwellii.AAC.1
MLLFDGFFFHTEEKKESENDCGGGGEHRKIKERDVEITFLAPEAKKEGREQNGNTHDKEKKSVQQQSVKVQGKGCNEF